jgi:hypothetical protein
MTKIVKICLKHGELTLDKIRVEKTTRNKLGYRYKCRECKLEQDAKWRLNNREKHRASAGRSRNLQRKMYREGLTTEIPKANIWQRIDRKNNPTVYKEQKNRHEKKHGRERGVTMDIVNYFKLTMEQYENLFLEHNNVCAICKKPETKKSRTPGKICRLAVDHCHKCWDRGTKGIKATRGLLCHDCNTGLGKFKDNIELLQTAIDYLKKHNHVE